MNDEQKPQMPRMIIPMKKVAMFAAVGFIGWWVYKRYIK